LIFRVLEVHAYDAMSEWSIQDATLKVLFAGLLKRVKWSFLGIAFAGILIICRAHRSFELTKMFLLRNASLVNQK
jgi:hypothetical protein